MTQHNNSEDHVKALSTDKDFECCSVSHKNGNKTYCIICAYRSPEGCYETFLEKLNHAILRAYQKSDYILLFGDLNVDYLLSNNIRTKLLMDILDTYNLHIATNLPTRLTLNKDGLTKGTAIDYAIHNLPQEDIGCRVEDLGFSDHLSINFAYKQPHVKTTQHGTYKIRNINEQNLANLSNELHQINWKSLESANNVHVAFETFLQIFTETVEKHCPIITKKISNNNKPWVTPDIKKRSDELKDMHWLLRNFKDHELERHYKQKQKEYKKYIQNRKHEYYKNVIDNADNKTKKIWNLVNNQLGKKKQIINIELKTSDDDIKESKNAANILGTYFSTSARNSVESRYGRDIPRNTTGKKCLANTFFCSSITTEEVVSTINDLKNSSPGIDEISTKIVKNVKAEIVEPLTFLLNWCLQSGDFPNVLKTAKVIPIYKRGDPSMPSNYRPISLLSVFSKILERILYRRIYNFMTKYNCISTSQHGFLPNKSTETASIELINYILSEIDKGNYVLGVYFDFSVAFDTIESSILLEKISKLGLRGPIHNLIKDFLTNRKITVKCNEIQSAEYNLDMGVVQGSVCGPLLFLLFANDLPQHIPYGKTVMYADDTSIIISSHDQREINNYLQTTLHEFEKWTQTNKLLLNEEKTICINFYNRKSLGCPLTATIGNTTLSLTNEVKYLGTHLDEELTWSTNLNKIHSKLNSGYYAILNLKKCFDTKTLIEIYYALIYPHISYNITLWGVAANVNTIFVKQKRIVRLLFNLGYMETCKPYFIKYRILTIYCLYILKVLKYIRLNINDMVKSNEYHSYNTRHNNILMIMRHKTTLFEKSPIYMGIKFYNKLPNYIKELSVKEFNKEVKKQLEDKAYYSIQEYLIDTW